MSGLNTQIRLGRKEIGLSQDKLADQVGVTQKTISRWETGKGVPDVDQLLSICQATGKDWAFFVPAIESRTALPATAGRDILARGEDYFGEEETMTLRILPDTAIRPGAGGNGFEVIDLGSIVELVIFKQFIHDLLGFWPPDTMEALRIIGTSMQPTFRSGQLVLVDPVEKLAGMVNLRTYVLSIFDERTGDWTPLAKRIITRPGGGFKIVSDNRAFGEDDMLLVPKEDGRLYDNETGQEIRMRVYGEVLWPTQKEERERVQTATDTLEMLIAEGSLQAASQR